MDIREERCSALREICDDRRFFLSRPNVALCSLLPVPCPLRQWPELRQLLREVEADAAVAFADGIETSPDDFACGDEGIEVGGLVVENARRKNLGLENGRG